jgi:uncharacterized protein YkwD
MNAFASIEHPITGRRVSIGSAAGNDLILAHKSVAARQAIIRHTRRGCYIRDLGSESGTFLNGRRIEREEPLRAGDELRFGAARFAMVAGDQPTSRLIRYVGAALGLMVLAAAGYLAVNFVRNWENLEQLASTSAPSVIEKPPEVALSAPHLNPALPNAELRSASAVPTPVWLAAINEYRAGVKLPPVAEDPKLSDADRKHAMYVVKNYEDKVSVSHLLGAEMHEEEKGNPWYTPEGHDAAALSDINQLWGYASPPSPTWALDEWMAGPFHRLWILNPRLHRVGYGEFCEKQYCVSALDLGSGATPSDGASPMPAPIEFPADKSITTLGSLEGEWPSPLTACAGFSAPSGLPVTIAFGAPVHVKLSEYQITRDGHGVQSCGIDADTYQNPVSAEQERGRSVLHELGAAIIVPRYPLRPGRYSVTATINNRAYQWSFTVSGTRAEPPPHQEAAASSTPASSKLSGKDDFEAALRAGYARAVKPDSESREEYERNIKQQQLAQAAKDAKIEAAKTDVAAKARDFQRRAETAFPDGPGAVVPAGATQWLAELNRDRAAVEVPPVVEDPTLSDGDLKHAKYVAMNYPARTQIGADTHSEEPSKPWFTPEGKAAAGQSDVAPYWYDPSPLPPPSTPSLMFINLWLVAPFHRPSLLQPELHKIGFGEFCQDRACAAALNASESLRPVPTAVPFEQPIMFPPQKYPVALTELQAEWPNPASGCAGYTFPVGLPITIQLGTNIDAKLSSYAVTQAAKPIEACGFDSTTYVNPNSADQERARTLLHWNGEVVIVPRMPLTRGATYEVSATVNDHPYSWSFTVSK